MTESRATLGGTRRGECWNKGRTHWPNRPGIADGYLSLQHLDYPVELAVDVLDSSLKDGGAR